MPHYINSAWVKANVIQRVVNEFARHAGYAGNELTTRLFAESVFAAPAPFPGKHPTRVAAFRIDSLGRVTWYHLGNPGKLPGMRMRGNYQVIEFDKENILRITWKLNEAAKIVWISPMCYKYYPVGFGRKRRLRGVYLAAIRRGVYVPRVLLSGITPATTYSDISNAWAELVTSRHTSRHRESAAAYGLRDTDTPRDAGQPSLSNTDALGYNQHYRLFASTIRDTNGHF